MSPSHSNDVFLIVSPVGVDVAAVGTHGGVPGLQLDLWGEGEGLGRLEGLAVDVVHQVLAGRPQTLVSLSAQVAGPSVETQVPEIVLKKGPQ